MPHLSKRHLVMVCGAARQNLTDTMVTINSLTQHITKQHPAFVLLVSKGQLDDSLLKAPYTTNSVPRPNKKSNTVDTTYDYHMDEEHYSTDSPWVLGHPDENIFSLFCPNSSRPIRRVWTKTDFENGKELSKICMGNKRHLRIANFERIPWYFEDYSGESLNGVVMKTFLESRDVNHEIKVGVPYMEAF